MKYYTIVSSFDVGRSAYHFFKSQVNHILPESYDSYCFFFSYHKDKMPNTVNKCKITRDDE